METLLDAPMGWGDIKSKILEYRETGLPTQELPSQFEMGDVLMDTFDQIQKAQTDEEIAEIMDSIQQMASEENIDEAVAMFDTFFAERARILKSDPDGTKLFVRTVDSVGSKQTLTGIRLEVDQLPQQFGMIHNHPVDGFPSDVDIVPLLTGDLVLQIIVTPKRVIFLAATKDTFLFKGNDPYAAGVGRLMAKGFLQEMGKQKGKLQHMPEFITNFLPREMPEHVAAAMLLRIESSFQKDRGWTIDYDSLKELHIAGYEAPRGEKVFTRKA